MLEDRPYMRRSAFESRGSATIALLVINFAAFLAQIVNGYPPHVTSGNYFALSVEGLRHGYVWQLITFQFMHGGLLHLLFNCWAIFVFGREVEEALGKRAFLTLYFCSGIIGGLVQALAGVLAENFGSLNLALRFGGPVVGASAGAFGLVAAFAVLYPERPLMLLLFFIIPVNMRAKFLLLVSALIAIFGIAFPAGNVAHAAHLGGMLTGIVFVRYAVHWHFRLPHLRQKPTQ